MGNLDYCKTCGMQTETVLVETPESPHYGKLECAKCGRYIKFVPKPDTDTTKYRRPQQHRSLVEKYSNGVCEFCLCSELELRPGTVLEAHHVHKYKNGGLDERENIWILCTKCHRLVHWMRRYVGRICVSYELKSSLENPHE